MVNEYNLREGEVVKVESRKPGDPKTTAKGGLVLARCLAGRLSMWKDSARMAPKRKDPTQGFPVEAVLAAAVYGLLSGGRGFSATEAMRRDGPLARLAGLRKAPSAETVEEVVKHVAEVDGIGPLNKWLRREVVKFLKRSKRKDLLGPSHGFVPVWGDGTLLEVEGKNFDSIKAMKGKRGQLACGVFVGPYAAAVDFAGEGVGEETVVREGLGEVFEEVIKPLRLAKAALVLLDSLYGDEPSLEAVESLPGKPAYIVGVSRLSESERVMDELPDSAWKDTGANPGRGWEASGVATAWLQCPGWETKRPMVCRRWRNKGEFFWRYAGVATSLDASDPRIERLMKNTGRGFEETVWILYGMKQGMENQWKELLSDLGLHHPPSAKARANAVFAAIVATAYNLSTAVRRLLLSGRDRFMRLWRFRRDWIDVSGYVVTNARYVIFRVTEACDDTRRRLTEAMGRLERL